MSLLSIDIETELFSEGCAAPRVVSMQLAQLNKATELYSRYEAIPLLSGLLDEGHEFVGQNVAYDFCCLAEEDYQLYGDEHDLLTKIFKAHADGRVFDTRIAEQLIDIARGQLRTERERYSLGTLALRYLGQELDKDEDGWRLRYGMLMDVPPAEWPERARKYASEDAEATLQVFRRQLQIIRELYENEGYKEQISFQTNANFVLQLMKCWGIRTDKDKVESLKQELIESLEKNDETLLEAGYLKPKTKGRGANKQIIGYSKVKANIEKAVQGAYMRAGIEYGKTPKGKPRTDRDTLESSGDDVLGMLADRDRFQKTLSFIPVLERATDHAWNPNWNVLVSTGRTSCGAPDAPGNLQQPPRKGGVRECVVARDGYVFAGCDFDTAELRALSQVCYSWFGFSEMREAFLNNRDLHSDLAASMLGLSYEEFVLRLKDGDPKCKDARQFAKIPNFGFPGGQGPASLAKFARKQKAKDLNGNYITEEQAKDLKYNVWQRKWTEMEPYLDYISSITGRGDDACIRQYRSGRVRGGLNFKNCANGFFQGLVADWAKDALFAVSRACYVDKSSPLFGSRIVIFAHDELILEVPVEKAAEAAEELRRIMVTTAQKWCDDVPVAATPVLMPVWFKGAEPIKDKTGKLIPYQPPPPKDHPKAKEIKIIQRELFDDGESVHWKEIEELLEHAH